MYFALQVCSYLVWLPLEILALIAILRGGVRRHPFVFAYLITSFLTAVMEMPISIISHPTPTQKVHFGTLYWFDEGVREVFIFAVVINLIYRTTANLESRRVARLLLVAGSVLFVAISFLVHYDSKVAFMGLWITPWTRDLKFCSAVLDMALWALLISSRKKDQTLLMLAGGMGIMFAGEAIGESIRSLSIPHSNQVLARIGNIVGLIADFAFLYIWWQALRREPRQAKKAVVV
jgi:hypothetical protein